MKRWLAIYGLSLLAVAPAQAEYNSKGKRDPFVPLLTSEGQRIQPPGFDEEVAGGIEGVSLQGIVFDPKAESYAILNGKVVREKEEVDGMEVVRIESDAVTLLVKGHPHRIPLSRPTEETQNP